MKTTLKKSSGWIMAGMFLLATITIALLSCSKEEDSEDCLTRTKRNQFYGYQVWAGDSAFFKNDSSFRFYYNIDKYYTLIDSATTTRTFNTGSYKYYVITARYYACIDAIQFGSGSYYNFGQGYTLIGGLAEHAPGQPPALTASRFLGAPDGISGNLGYKDICHEPNSFGGFITDDSTITTRGGGLTVYVVENCY